MFFHTHSLANSKKKMIKYYIIYILFKQFGEIGSLTCLKKTLPHYDILNNNIKQKF